MFLFFSEWTTEFLKFFIQVMAIFTFLSTTHPTVERISLQKKLLYYDKLFKLLKTYQRLKKWEKSKPKSTFSCLSGFSYDSRIFLKTSSTVSSKYMSRILLVMFDVISVLVRIMNERMLHQNQYNQEFSIFFNFLLTFHTSWIQIQV